MSTGTAFPGERYEVQRVRARPGSLTYDVRTGGELVGRFVEAVSTTARLGRLATGRTPRRRVVRLEDLDGSPRLSVGVSFVGGQDFDARVEDPAGRVLGEAAGRGSTWVDRGEEVDLRDAAGVAVGSLTDGSPAYLLLPDRTRVGRWGLPAEQPERSDGGLVLELTLDPSVPPLVRDLAAAAVVAREVSAHRSA